LDNVPHTHLFLIDDLEGPINGYRPLTLRRAELVVVRITATISIARQGPPVFKISAGGPAAITPPSRNA